MILVYFTPLTILQDNMGFHILLTFNWTPAFILSFRLVSIVPARLPGKHWLSNTYLQTESTWKDKFIKQIDLIWAFMKIDLKDGGELFIWLLCKKGFNGVIYSWWIEDEFYVQKSVSIEGNDGSCILNFIAKLFSCLFPKITVLYTNVIPLWV